MVLHFDGRGTIERAIKKMTSLKFELKVFRLLKWAFVLTICASCGHRSDVMEPVKVKERSSSVVDMLVATTRSPSDNLRIRYTGERGDALRIDNIVVSIPSSKARKLGRVQWPVGKDPDTRKEFATLEAKLLNETEVMPWFHKSVHSKRRVLIFVHGFNNDYSEAVYRFAQVVHDARIDAAPVLFTWPSRGKLFSYVYDRESTIYSRAGLREALEAATMSKDVGEVVVLAHSMGTWLTMEALRDFANIHGRISPKISTVFLASPDIDVDVFYKQVLEFGDKRPAITILTSQKDLPLKLSSWLAGDVERIGVMDFSPHKALLERYGITVLDSTEATNTGSMGHSAFTQNDDILRSLNTTFLRRPEPGRAALLPVNALKILSPPS